MDLLVATRNPKKLAELQPLLQPLGYRLHTLDAFPTAPVDVAETGTTFEENALLKARSGVAATGMLTLAEDSGLVVDALGGRPGIHSARYAPNQASKVARLLDELAGTPVEERTCRYVCVLALAAPNGSTVTLRATCEGRIGAAPQGSNGFDYDVVFELPDGHTMAELSASEKNAISHRRKAVEQLPEILSSFR